MYPKKFLFAPRLIVAALVLLFVPNVRASEWAEATSGVGYDLEFVRFFNGRFVAGGFGEEASGIVYSEDGENWISAILPEGFSVRSVGESPDGLFAAGELEGAAAFCFSEDGIVWEAGGTSLVVAAPVVQTEYAAGKFWLVLENGELWASVDAETWEQVNAQGSVLALREFDGGAVVAGERRILHFRDVNEGQLAWPQASQFSRDVLALAGGEDRAVALMRLGEEVAFAVSGDGIVWLVFGYEGEEFDGISYAGDRFWASGAEMVYSSRDGVRWTNRSTGLEGAHIRAVAAGSGSMVAVGDAGAVFVREVDEVLEIAETTPASETFPTEWEQVGTVTGNLSRVAANGAAVFALGHLEDFRSSLSRNTGMLPAAWSSDGNDWRSASFGAGSSSGWIALGSVGDRFWLGNGDSGRVAFSRDGIAWRELRVPGFQGTLVGEHQGKLFIAGGGEIYFEQPNGDWVGQGIAGSSAGGYITDGDSLWIGGRDGVFKWKDGAVERVPQSMGHWEQPRLLGNSDRFLRLSRGNGPGESQTYISRDGRNWTGLIGQLEQARDGIFEGGHFWAVGAGFVQSSSDGIWWADRAAGIGSATLSGIAAGEEFLYAVGDNGRIFRRSLRLEPAFIQHPVSAEITAGQSVRFIGRVSDESGVRYQWYRNGLEMVDETGPVLEIRETKIEDNGTSFAVAAIGEAGTTMSKPATLTVREGPVTLHLSKNIGEIPVSSIYGHRIMRDVFRVDDRIAVATNSGELIAISRDGISWVLTVPPIRVLDKISDAGGRLFATGSDGGQVSVDGIFWEAVSGMPTGITKVGDGNGVYVAAGSNGLYWSADGTEWNASNVADRMTFLARGDGRWVASGDRGAIWISEDGRSWTSRERPDSTKNNVSALAAGNGYILVGTSDGNLHRSIDGENWETGSGNVAKIRFFEGFFWGSGGGLYVSPDGRHWARRVTNFPGDMNAEFIRMDETEMLVLVDKRILRKGIPLRPAFYSPAAAVGPAFPGDNYLLKAPAHHGDPEATYVWKRGGVPISGATENAVTLADFQAGDAGSYTVEATSPFGSDSATFSIPFIGNYNAWGLRFFRLSPEGDPGGYGIPNFLRYAFHLDPVAPDRTLLPRVGREIADGESYIALEFQLMAGVEDFSWVCETSNDLVEWSEFEDWTIERDERIESRRYLKLRLATEPESEESAFYRIRVTRIEP